MIKQDADLIDHITNNAIKECVAVGDVEYFDQYVRFVNGPSTFGMFIQNTSFQWHQLADQVNQFLSEKIQPGGTLYLSINKYLAGPTIHSPPLSNNYDEAICQFIQHHIPAQVKSYSFDPDDQGQKFNFAHPLTRFYLQKHDS